MFVVVMGKNAKKLVIMQGAVGAPDLSYSDFKIRIHINRWIIKRIICYCINSMFLPSAV